MTRIEVSLPDHLRSYPITIGTGLLHSTYVVTTVRKYGNRCIIITDNKIKALYGNAFCAFIRDQNISTDLFSFPPEEKNKTRETKATIEDKMLANGHGHDSCLIALGGGIATDMGGFIAATYHRGIHLINIPTSLLAMVDASIGGKNGINSEIGKNHIGTIYQPKEVIIDPTLCKTLSPLDLNNGIVEMIKHGIISDKHYFAFLEQYCDALTDTVILEAIERSCIIKKTIVEEDEREGGRRRILNFGHTVGHAIETMTDYSISHGEAVALGMLAESRMALKTNMLDAPSFDRINAILSRCIRNTSITFCPEKLFSAMSSDKKAENGIPRFVLITGIGSTSYCHGKYCTTVDANILLESLRWLCYDSCNH